MTKPIKPMLAYTVEDTSKLQYPLLGSVKLDGIRIIINNSTALTRSLKPIPNAFVSEFLSDPLFEGLDGEIIVGPANADDVYRVTSSAVMSKKGEPDFSFYVFDTFPIYEHEPFHARLARLKDKVRDLPRVKLVDQVTIHSEQELLDYEETTLNNGFEGLMVRSNDGVYKHGRSTAKAAELGKLKRFVDSEARIVGFECLYKNGNEATINELGYTERSSHKENKIPQDTLGVLIGEDIHTGIEVRIGSGFTAQQRKELWEGQDNLIGKLAKYKYFPIGIKDSARFPIFQGLRSQLDLS